MMGVKWPMPMPPRLVMVNVPPVISSSDSLPARARDAISVNSTDSWVTVFWSAWRITGTTNPRGVSAATPTLTYFL